MPHTKRNSPILALFCGAYGSGKGLQSTLWADRLQKSGWRVARETTSDLLAEAAKEDPEIRAIMEQRQGVPNEIVNRLVGAALEAALANGCEIVALDGYPRHYPTFGLSQVDSCAELANRLGFEGFVAHLLPPNEDFCHTRIEQRIEEFRRLKKTPRREDVDVEVRTRGLREHFEHEGKFLEHCRRRGFKVVTLCLENPTDSPEFVLQKLSSLIEQKIFFERPHRVISPSPHHGAIASPFAEPSAPRHVAVA